MFDEPVSATTGLYEEISKEIWQCQLISDDGRCLGNIVSQIVERRLWTVRYLIVYDPLRAVRILLPAVLVTGAEPGRVLCSISAADVAKLPEYNDHLSRVEELRLHQVLEREPYWEEESDYLSPMSAIPPALRDDPLEPI